MPPPSSCSRSERRSARRSARRGRRSQCEVGRPVQPVVEHLVLREVVLPEPAARERDARARKVDRGPVPGGIDGLDAVRRREVLPQVVDRWLPVASCAEARRSRGRSSTRAGSGSSEPASRRASAATRERRQLRSERTSTAIGSAAKRTRAMFSPSGEATAKATPHVDGVGDEEPADRRARLDVPGQCRAEPAEEQDGAELEDRERVVAAVRESAGEQELGSPRRPRRSAWARAVAGRGPACRARCRRGRSRAAGTRAGSRRPSGPRGCRSASACPPGAPRCESKPSAMPRANGNAAEMTRPAQTTANVLLDQRASGPHCRPTTTANASAAVAIDATASGLIPRTPASG